MSTIVPTRTALPPREHTISLRGLTTCVAGLLPWLLAIGVTYSVRASSGDYGVRLPVSADNAEPALTALIHLDLAAFAARQPVMGLLSLMVRAPAAALAVATAAGGLETYRIGALACLVPCALASSWLALSRRGSLTGLAGGTAAAAIVIAGSASSSAVRSGHPEEILAAVLACLAVVAAQRGRGGWAGVLLGLAVGTKQWAIVAALPVLLALQERRTRAAAIATAVGAVLILTAPLADPAAFTRAAHALGAVHIASAVSAWWPFSSGPSVRLGMPVYARMLPFGLDKSAALALTLAPLGAALAAAAIARRRRGATLDPLALLVLLGLARCVLDPGPVEYYYVALTIPMAFWETLTKQRLPVLSLACTLLAALTLGREQDLAPVAANALTLLWTGALGCYLAAQALHLGAGGGRRALLRVAT
jgi:hypothetical protein